MIMKAPQWRQNILLVSDDPEISLAISPAFKEESQFIIAKNTEEALIKLENTPIQVLIIDAKTTDPSRGFYEQYYDEKEEVPFIELSQYASQLNHGLTIILLVNKLLSKEGNFARKCGAVLIMDRKNILTNRMLYLIGVLRKRTFRTILTRDLPPDTVFSVNLYYHISSSNRYLPFLLEGTPFNQDKREKIQSLKVKHLYVLESDLSMFLSDLRNQHNALYFSETLSSIRNQYRQLLIQLFDLSTDGMITFGKELYDKGLEIASQLEKLIDRFPDHATCLQELPYPRWSTIAHSLNCGIYAIIFAKHCQLPARKEIVFAAMIHNVGFSEINQDLLNINESNLSPLELEEYKKHVQISLEILRKKMMPFTPLIETIILQHHENFDGTGFPFGVAGENLLLESALVSLIGSYDYFNTVRPGEKALTASEAWQALREHHNESTSLNKKYHPKLLTQLDEFFMGIKK